MFNNEHFKNYKIKKKLNATAGTTLISTVIVMVITLTVLIPTTQWLLSLKTSLHQNYDSMNMETLALGEYNTILNESYIEVYNKQGSTKTKETSDGKYRINIIYGNEEVVDGTEDMPLNSIPIEIRVEEVADSSNNFVLNHKVVSNTDNSELIHKINNLVNKANKLKVPCHQNETRYVNGCQCNSGYEKINKRCVLKCNANQTRNSNGVCVSKLPQKACREPNGSNVVFKTTFSHDTKKVCSFERTATRDIFMDSFTDGYLDNWIVTKTETTAGLIRDTYCDDSNLHSGWLQLNMPIVVSAVDCAQQTFRNAPAYVCYDNTVHTEYVEKNILIPAGAWITPYRLSSLFSMSGIKLGSCN